MGIRVSLSLVISNYDQSVEELYPAVAVVNREPTGVTPLC